ncbi:uncharacterized protein [Paramisgurnus dabryanus]|uniref:uncharacterized protein n=1 Tax=Paramisgurnus dabryanus TaxID=90735 RepID=UPI0031F35317
MALKTVYDACRAKCCKKRHETEVRDGYFKASLCADWLDHMTILLLNFVVCVQISRKGSKRSSDHLPSDEPDRKIVSGIREFLQSEIMNFRLSSLILLLHIQGSLTLDNFNVTCNKLSICAVRGTGVSVWCNNSNNINIRTGFWFSQKQRTNWRNQDEPEDLTLDSDYSVRVDQWITKNNLYLGIEDVRERDSGEYQLMFIMKDGVKHLSSVTINLTVTVLQVIVSPESTEQRVKLSCDSSCPLTSEHYYYWYKNGQHLINNQHIFVSSSGNTDTYSCFESYSVPSSSVCLSNSSCWGVTYTSTRVCALVGSTVDIHSTYSHPPGYTVVKTSWHYIHSWRNPPWRFNHWKFSDLRYDHQFAGRVEFVGNTLRIKDVNRNDTGVYLFRIINNTSDEFSGLPGVTLIVTDTQVRSSPDPVIDGEKVILSCSTECTLDSNHTYIWYKNGQQVTDGFTLLNKLYLDSINSKELQEYSCTVGDTMDSSVSLCLLVFLPQFLIIGALWMGFFISMNKLS